MTVLALIAAATLAVVSPAPTAPSVSTEPAAPAVRVAYGDLDLASASGADALDSRIARASARTCRAVSGRSIAGRADCQSAFREEALSRLPVSAREDYAQSRARRLEL